VDEERRGATLSDEFQQLTDNLALPLKKTLLVAQKHSSLPCCLRDSQMSLDFQGNVILCCGVFDAGKFALGNYLDMPLDEIQRIRQSHSMCERCMRKGAHVYLTYRIPEMDELLLENIAPEDAELLDLRNEISQKKMQLLLQRVFQRLFSWFMTKEQKTALKALFTRILR